MSRIIIFDFDGVLADTEELMLRFSGIACAELGYPIWPTRLDLEAVEQMSFANLGRRLGLPEELIPAYVNRSLQLFSTNPSPLRIFPGMAHVITQLSLNTYLGIVSGNTTPAIQKFLEENHLTQAVQVIISADSPGSKPEKIRRILAMVSTLDRAVYVGDTASDVRAARETSITSVAVTWGHHSRQMLLDVAPDYLVDSPEELLSVLTQ